MNRMQWRWTLTALSLVAIAAGCQSTSHNSSSTGVNHYVRGAMAEKNGDKNEAVASLSKAVHEDPNLMMARLLLGDLYRSDAEYKKAQSLYADVTRLDPYGYRGFYSLGVTCQFLNEFQAAAVAYSKSLQLKPDHVESATNLGTIYLTIGQTEEAIKQMQKAVEIDPKSAAAWANLGVALDTAGRLPEAEHAYRQSLELDSDAVPTRLNLGTNLTRQNRPEEAQTLLKRVVEEADSFLARKRLGDAYLQANKFDEALTEYRKSVALNGDYPPALNGVADALIAQYQAGSELDDASRRNAVEAWQRSMRLNADQPRVKECLAKWEKAGS